LKLFNYMKQLFLWCDVYETGVPLVDEQHKIWLSIMNEFYNSFVRGNSVTQISQIFQKLKDYSNYHFKTEENLLKNLGESVLESQKSEHKKFLKEINNFELEYENGSDEVTLLLMDFIQTWFIQHILKSDKKDFSEMKKMNLFNF